MLDNSSTSGYPFNWTGCLDSFPEFYRPLPSNTFLDEYGAGVLGGMLGAGSGTASAMGSLRHCLSQPLQPSSISASSLPEHLQGGSEHDDVTMISSDVIDLERRWFQMNNAANRTGNSSNRMPQDCCIGITSSFQQSLVTSGTELVMAPAAMAAAWKSVISTSMPGSESDFQTSPIGDTPYGSRYSCHSTLKMDHYRQRSKMRLVDEPLGSSSLNRAAISDPFFDVGGILIDDRVAQSAAASNTPIASSAVPTSHYSPSLDQPTICSALQTRLVYDDDKLRQHHHASTTMTSSWSGSGRTLSQQQRRRRSANKSQDGGTALSAKSSKSDSVNERRFMEVSSETSLSGNSKMTSAGEVIMTSHRQQNQEDLSGVDGIGCGNESRRINPDWTNLVTAMNLHPTIPEKELPSVTRFQYIMCAATSPAVKHGEEQLTYLNQGQSYEIKLKRLLEAPDERLFTTIIRVVFHERRLQYVEREQLEHWRMLRPGERFLDIDLPISYGLIDVKTDPSALNSVEVTWNADSEAGVFVRVNCISTEFTARKHGGEKGVPFRVQVETYSPVISNGCGASVSDVTGKRLLHCASCQIKVFKPKGADRKQKTDMEKVDKRPVCDREKYQASFDNTVLNEIPLEHVTQYLDQLQRQSQQPRYDRAGGGDVDSVIACSSAYSSSLGCGNASAESAVKEEASIIADCGDLGQSSVIGGALSGQSHSHKSLASLQPGFHFSDDESYFGMLDGDSKFNHDARCPSWTSTTATPIPDRQDTTQTVIPTPTITSLSPDTSSYQVVHWLSAHRFHNCIQVFQNFSGADLLRLTREDLVQLCGLPDGIRLNNLLHSRSVRPRLTVYVHQKQTIAPVKWIRRCSQSNTMLTVTKATSTSSSSSSSSTGYWSPMSDVSAGGLSSEVRPLCQFQAISASSLSDFFVASPCSQPSMAEAMISSLSGPSSLASNCSSSSPSSAVSFSPRPSRSSAHRVNRCRSAIELSGTGSRRLIDDEHKSNSGSFLDEVDVECSAALAAAAKRRRRDIGEQLHGNVRVMDENKINRRIYHAVYLECPTRYNLVEKLATLYGFDVRQVTDMIIVEALTGIQVYVTDSVVQNLEDQSTYTVQLKQDFYEPVKFRILLQSECS